MPETNDGRLDRIKLHLADAKSREFYSIQRIDLLVISISGAGIYLTFETLKFLIQHGLQMEKGLLTAGAISFVLAIILNFVSQWTSFYANKNEVAWAQLEHKVASGDKLNDDERCDQKYYDRVGAEYGKWTRGTNMSSTVLMLTGTALMLAFYFSVLAVV